jgi:hypothetical protein
MIRVSIFLIECNAPRGWQGLVYIGRNINPEPSDQTDLNGWCGCSLGGGKNQRHETEADGGPYKSASLQVGPPWCGIL